MRVVSVLLGLALGASVAFAADTLDSPFGFHPASVAKIGYSRNGHADALDIGVRWTREGVYVFWFLVQKDLHSNTYDFSLHDRQFALIPPSLQILANIAPQADIDEGYCLPGSYVPIDGPRYSAFVRAAVERYDGDGRDDMPGLVNPIRYWQVGNEPTTRRSGFAQLQEMTYKAIKDACADCTVLIGGVPGMPPVDTYLEGFDREYKPILDALGGRYVDVFDFHWYGNATGDYRGVAAVAAHIRAVLAADGFPQIPIWIAEMGAYSGKPATSAQHPLNFPEQSERQQALDYFKRFVYSLSIGIARVFPAFGLMEGFKHDDRYFDHTGLIYDGQDSGDGGLGTRKLAWFTYRKMTGKLEGAEWTSIETLQESEHIFICRVRKDGTWLYIAWWDYFDDPARGSGATKTAILTGLNAPSVRVTGVLPDAATGKEVTDENSAFPTSTMKVVDGRVAIELGDSPVIIEEIAFRRRAVRGK